MLHVTTEIGRPGKRERERRHFPEIHNQKSVPVYRSQGRRYIPHGYGIYDDWRPHPQHVDIEYSDVGPDWKSKLRYIPKPNSSKYPAAEIFPDNWKAMRPFPYTYMKSEKEWLLDPDLLGGGIKTKFNGEHLATRTSAEEITHQMLFGKGRNLIIIDKRNGIPEATPGDKSYQVPEYSPEFHKNGSTLPVINFGANSPKKTTDTFVPLDPLPRSPRELYKNKESKRKLEEEKKSVKDLDKWKPAPPIETLVQEEVKK
ncbi:hypothetical protein CHS0354_026646 [Potamilus streckersoni]|uniref:Uncharacterized protein n=1 Tax=Potamilus streckersoni TaxID=2493646 RepID=A0AAE0SZF8_9BIVA|nr:hypothetical protein CHS0354_026646 [Potamilus streckersoni]